MAKTASFGFLHLGTSFGVSYALTGNLAIAGAVTFVEPLVNTVMHHFFDKHWDGFAAGCGRLQAKTLLRARSRAPSSPASA